MALALLLAGAFGTAAAADGVAPAAGAPKTHVLFVGADIAVERDREFLPIEGVSEDTLLARAGEKRVKVKISPDLPLQITENVKITNTEATIEGFKAEPAFTPAADPIRRMGDAVGMAATAGAMQDQADAAVRGAEGDMGYASAMAANASGPEERAMWGAQAAAAASRLGDARNTQAATAIPSGDIGQASAGLSAMGRQENQFDAIRISFVVTAEQELAKPHYAVIARLRDPGSKPGQFRKWVYVRALDRLRPGDSRRVLIFQGGFAPGYTLDECEVHVYDGAREFATNLSRRRVEVTADEAHQFRVVSYVTANKGRTVPAKLAVERLPAEARQALAAAGTVPCHVRLSKGGKVLAVYADADGKRVLEDPALKAALEPVYFYPALEQGKAVESMAELK